MLGDCCRLLHQSCGVFFQPTSRRCDISSKGPIQGVFLKHEVIGCDVLWRSVHSSPMCNVCIQQEHKFLHRLEIELKISSAVDSRIVTARLSTFSGCFFFGFVLFKNYESDATVGQRRQLQWCLCDTVGLLSPILHINIFFYNLDYLAEQLHFYL